MDAALRYEKIRADEVAECAAIAVRSFLNYEFFANYVPDPGRRERFLRSMMNIEFAVNREISELWAAKEGGRIAAVAMLCSPDYRKPSDAQYLRAGFWRTFLAGGIRDVAAWNAMNAEACRPCHDVPGAWYLSSLTVDPACQGRGVGRAMILDCIEPDVRRQGGTELVLFTNSEDNRRFYRKLGFEEFDERFYEYRGRRMGSWSCRKRL